VIGLRLTFALAAAAATLALGASAGGAFAGNADAAAMASGGRATPGEIPVGDALEASGQPMRLSILYTRDRPSRVVMFYADAFRARGLLPVLSGADAPAHVSVFDPADGLQRFVSALAQPDGQTLVLTGTVDPRRPAQLLRSASGASVPIPPEHRAFFGFRSRDGEARAESAQFSSALEVGEVGRFYRQALGRDGYVESAGAGEGLLLFRRPGASISVALQKLSAGAGSAVFVTRIEGDPR
jgi:hypothetical protein